MAWVEALVGQVQHPYYGIVSGFSKDNAIFKTIAEHRIWEPELVELFPHFVRKNSVALDCGANIGVHSIAMCKAQPALRQVLSFEPHPDIFPILSLNVAAYSKIKAMNAGVSNASGTMYTRQVADSENPGGSLLFESESQVPDDETRPVQVLNLDSLRLDDVSFIKIDVEGHEERVIEGARSLLATQRPTLIVEIWDLDDLTKRSQKISDICSIGYTARPITSIDMLFVDERKPVGL